MFETITNFMSIEETDEDDKEVVSYGISSEVQYINAKSNRYGDYFSCFVLFCSIAWSARTVYPSLRVVCLAETVKHPF